MSPDGPGSRCPFATALSGGVPGVGVVWEQPLVGRNAEAEGLYFLTPPSEFQQPPSLIPRGAETWLRASSLLTPGQAVSGLLSQA